MRTERQIAAANLLEAALVEIHMAWRTAYAALPESEKAYFDGYVNGWLKDDEQALGRGFPPKTVLGYMATAVEALRIEGDELE